MGFWGSKKQTEVIIIESFNYVGLLGGRGRGEEGANESTDDNIG